MCPYPFLRDNSSTLSLSLTCTYADAKPAVTKAGKVLLNTSPIMGLATLKSPNPQQPTKKLVIPSAWNCGVLMATAGDTLSCVLGRQPNGGVV